MSSDISQENEQFIQQVIREGTYQDRSEVLDDALELLKERRELLEHIDIGTKQLKNGEYTEFNDVALRELFDEIQTRGRKRYEASKNKQ